MQGDLEREKHSEGAYLPRFDVPEGMSFRVTEHRLERVRDITEYKLNLTHKDIAQDTLRRYRDHAKQEFCTSSSYTLSAAEVLGMSSQRACPYCRKKTLRELYWIHGESAGHYDGTNRTGAEITSMLNTLYKEYKNLYGSDGSGKSGEDSSVVELELTISTTENCTHCGWNYLLVQYIF